MAHKHIFMQEFKCICQKNFFFFMGLYFLWDWIY